MPCRRLWQVDWAEAGSTWAIVCPGPSLERTYERIPPSAPTMLVDGAAFAPIPAGWWVTWGGPTKVHDLALRARLDRRDFPIRWHVTGGYPGPWHSFLAVTEQRDAWVVGEHREDPMPGDWSLRELDRGPSWLLAVRAAVLRGRARRIELYGLDLRGEGYAFDCPDPRRRTPEEWEGRWESERALLGRLRALLPELEVELVEVRP